MDNSNTKPEGPPNIIFTRKYDIWTKIKTKIETFIGFDMILGIVFGFAWAYILFIIGISLKWIGNSLGVY